ncbi:alpha-amylase family glycosyl hydrolase [Chungangia koreensis]|uniref:Alpha-amylase family glycosyl hydrolase n=1 Tax=Chungangia koreensis TaxID=752657 RepID=A0ABV8X0P9_9LACT
MKRLKFTAVLAAILLLTSIAPATYADGQRTIVDESVYDLLVDRFFNYTNDNNFDVDYKDPNAFNGGDLLGVKEKLTYLNDMGFTVVNLGPIFDTERYDGRLALSYDTIEEHFGTPEDLKALVDAAHELDMKITVDIPLSRVSAQHIWTSNENWALPNEDGTIDWNLDLPEVREALTNAVVGFISTHNLDGVRLIATDGIDTEFLNDLIGAIKDAEPSAYVMGDGDTGANFDLAMYDQTEEILRELFVAFDQPSSQLSDLPVSNENTAAIYVDTPFDSRFTYDIVSERMFPPTRWNLIMTTFLTLPGTPVIQYGTEIAVNGEKAPESHPILSFKSDDELIKHIADLNYLRNESEALRSGKYELLKNEDGMMVYKRWNDEETWIIAVNNTSETHVVELDDTVIGESDSILRGLLDGDIVRPVDYKFNITMDRETAEVFIVNEDRGINKGYILALILVWILFIGFLTLVWRQGKKRKEESSK